MDPYFVYEQWLQRDWANEKLKYLNGFDEVDKKICSQNQNDFCQENRFNGNN